MLASCGRLLCNSLAAMLCMLPILLLAQPASSHLTESAHQEDTAGCQGAVHYSGLPHQSRHTSRKMQQLQQGGDVDIESSSSSSSSIEEAMDRRADELFASLPPSVDIARLQQLIDSLSMGPTTTSNDRGSGDQTESVQEGFMEGGGADKTAHTRTHKCGTPSHSGEMSAIINQVWWREHAMNVRTSA